MKQMTILQEAIKLSDGYISIYELKFLRDNPRIYACTHGEPDFGQLPEGQQQEIIYKKLREEPSVKNLLPDIKRHGGLMEPILVHHKTMEVIEGNSRLAVYRQLHEDPRETGEWERIPCDIVSSLTDRQQAAFLNQIHVKGKTQWSPFEKANFAYVRKEKGADFKEIANLFGESEQTIRTRIKIIGMMEKNGDNDRSHFSYYNVIVRNTDISNAMKDGKLPNLLQDIKNLGPDDGGNEDATNEGGTGIAEPGSPEQSHNRFTALDLRDKLPVVLKKDKVLRKYRDGEIDLDEAYQRARTSHVEENIKRATALLDDISGVDVSKLENNAFNAFKHAVRKLGKRFKRIKKMTDRDNTEHTN